MTRQNLSIDEAIRQIGEAQAVVGAMPGGNAESRAADETPVFDSARGAFVSVGTEGVYQTFPADLLPPVMRDMARECERVKCVDPVTAALPMLSVAGACIGNTRRAYLADDFQAPAVIWSAVALASGERKSPVLRAVMEPIHARQAELAETHRREMETHRAAMKKWKSTPRDQRDDEPDPPGAFPHLYLSDTTVEAIAIRLVEQPRGLICVHDELNAFFQSFNAYKQHGNDRESYLAFFDAGAAKIDRKTSIPPTIFVPRAFIAVTGMIQPGILRAALGESEYASGLAARFLLASPPPRQSKWTPGGMDSRVRDAWRDTLHRLMSLTGRTGDGGIEPIPLPLTEAAMKRWTEAYDRLAEQMHRSGDDRERAALSKLSGYIPRIALILQMTSWASQERGASDGAIDDTSLRRAVELVDWFAHETRRIYGILIEDEDDAERRSIIDLIQRRGGSISPRELHRARRQFRTVDDADSYLDGLAGAGRGGWTWASTGGRPSRVFHLAGRADADESPSGAIKNGGFVSSGADEGGRI